MTCGTATYQVRYWQVGKRKYLPEGWSQVTKKRKPAKTGKSAATAAQRKLAAARKRNAAIKAKQVYDDDGAQVLLAAYAAAMVAKRMPNLPNAEARRNWCRANGAASVRRDQVCRKMTNYRADNAIRQRLAKHQEIGAASESLTIVWNANNADAALAPFTPESETVFIVRV